MKCVKSVKSHLSSQNTPYSDFIHSYPEIKTKNNMSAPRYYLRNQILVNEEDVTHEFKVIEMEKYMLTISAFR